MTVWLNIHSLDYPIFIHYRRIYELYVYFIYACKCRGSISGQLIFLGRDFVLDCQFFINQTNNSGQSQEKDEQTYMCL